MFLAVNYDDIYFASFDYCRCSMQVISPDEQLYILDTDDWSVEKISADKLISYDKYGIYACNICKDDVDGDIYFNDSLMDLTELIEGCGSLGVKDTITAKPSKSGVYIFDLHLFDKDYTVSSKVIDGDVAILLNNKVIFRIDADEEMGVDSLYISYAFKTKKYFVVRMGYYFTSSDCLFAFTLVFSEEGIVDAYSCGSFSDFIKLVNFKPKDVRYHTKSIMKGVPY